MSHAIEHCIMNWELLVGWAGGSIRDMSKKELLFQPAENCNHAWWLYGRSVLFADIAHYLTDTPVLTPKEWRVLFNTGSSPSTTGEGYPSREELITQLCNSIQWQSSIEYMVDNGVSTFIEIGPGKVLTGLTKRINKDVTTVNIGDSETIKRFS